MFLFLHNIFPLKIGGYVERFIDYNHLLYFYSKRSYKTLAKKMCQNSLMNIRLDLNTNNTGFLNENYAREFLELFTVTKETPYSNGNSFQTNVIRLTGGNGHRNEGQNETKEKRLLDHDAKQ